MSSNYRSLQKNASLVRKKIAFIAIHSGVDLSAVKMVFLVQRDSWQNHQFELDSSPDLKLDVPSRKKNK